MAVLVVGGAGYVGSHNAAMLAQAGREVVVADNLRTGHRGALPEGMPFYRVDIRDGKGLDEIFARERVDAVLHFAASSLVGESMEKPLEYFDNNIGGMICLLSAMARRGVRNIVFSSSAAVYGQPDISPIPEDAPLLPTNPYGESKLAMERMMRWAAEAHGMRHVILRYFNVAGAWPGGHMGEDHRPESHLIPLILRAPLGRGGKIKVFGQDYPTRDGTCVRDYIDVMDLADAHLKALEYLEKGGEPLVCNLGNGQGFSVLEVIEAARRVTGHPIHVEHAPRRPGDPATLVASADLARRKLGWTPTRGLDDILASAWEWHRTHPRGYAE